MNTSRFDLYRLLSLLALLAAAGCSCGGWEVQRQITPWLRIENRSPYVDLPHAVEVGEHAVRVTALRDGRWQPLEAESLSPQAQPFDGGRRAIVGAGQGNTRWSIVREEGGSPLELPAVCEAGPLRTLSDDALVCVACPRVPGGPRCVQFEVARFDVNGEQTDGSHLQLPPEYDGCEIYQMTTVGLVREHAAVMVRLHCDAPTPARPGRQDGCALLSVEPGQLRTELDLDQSEPCCPYGEWKHCVSSGAQYTPRYDFP